MNGDDFLNLTMTIKRGVSYQQLLNVGFSQEDILATKKAILYVEACYRNKLKGEQQKNG